MKKENKAMFVKTQDSNTADELKKIGFKLVDYTNETWTFMNNPNCPLTFDNNKVVYTNMLCF